MALIMINELEKWSACTFEKIYEFFFIMIVMEAYSDRVLPELYMIV